MSTSLLRLLYIYANSSNCMSYVRKNCKMPVITWQNMNLHVHLPICIPLVLSLLFMWHCVLYCYLFRHMHVIPMFQRATSCSYESSILYRWGKLSMIFRCTKTSIMLIFHDLFMLGAYAYNGEICHPMSHWFHGNLWYKNCSTESTTHNCDTPNVLYYTYAF